ncbi:unnamed protein product [Urochloa humidicola]
MAGGEKRGGTKRTGFSPRIPTPAPTDSSPLAPAAAPPRPSSNATWWPELRTGIHGGQASFANPWGGYLNILQQHY